jgi:hypothetical protein
MYVGTEMYVGMYYVSNLTQNGLGYISGNIFKNLSDIHTYLCIYALFLAVL